VFGKLWGTKVGWGTGIWVIRELRGLIYQGSHLGVGIGAKGGLDLPREGGLVWEGA